jgi:hypothetical protein
MQSISFLPEFVLEILVGRFQGRLQTFDAFVNCETPYARELGMAD